MGTPKGTRPWNAGTSKGWVDARGYRWVYVMVNGKRVARREHRVLVEAAIGRRLEPWELVHHKDGNPSNNSIDNLEVTTWEGHAKDHSVGTRKNYEARRTMEAFALMREELRRQRTINADLLAALEGTVAELDRLTWVVCEQDGEAIEAVLTDARAAIAKAKGGEG